MNEEFGAVKTLGYCEPQIYFRSTKSPNPSGTPRYLSIDISTFCMSLMLAPVCPTSLISIYSIFSLASVFYWVFNYLLAGEPDIYCRKVIRLFEPFHHHQEFKLWTTVLHQDMVAICRHWIVKLNAVQSCDLILENCTMTWKKTQEK